MTLDEFFRALKEDLPPHLFGLHEDGAIRTELPGCPANQCPLAAYAWWIRHEDIDNDEAVFWARDNGLPYGEAVEVICAADNERDCDRKIRQRLIAACGIED